MKPIYLLLSFLNFQASLRTAASLQAKKGCYRRPEPPLSPTTCPTDDSEHPQQMQNESIFSKHTTAT